MRPAHEKKTVKAIIDHLMPRMRPVCSSNDEPGHLSLRADEQYLGYEASWHGMLRGSVRDFRESDLGEKLAFRT
jgi:hypothetical protein